MTRCSGGEGRLRDLDVLVIGTGPTGLTMALALATRGVRVHLATRERWVDDAPDLQPIDAATMEIFRALGVADDLATLAEAAAEARPVLFATSLACRGRRAEAIDGSVASIAIAHAALVGVLLSHATARGATVAFNSDYLGHEQDGDGVSVTLHDRVLDRIYTVRARHVFGADGAGSRVAEAAGLPIAHRIPQRTTIEARFTADLTHRLGASPSRVNLIIAPDPGAGRAGAGLLCAVTPWDRWVARWDATIARGGGKQDDALVRRSILGMIGDDDVAIEIESVVVHRSSVVTTCYADDRVLCGGDAVRRRASPLGDGVDIGVQDAFNLAWKLALVGRGEAGAGLLDSYTAERAPFAGGMAPAEVCAPVATVALSRLCRDGGFTLLTDASGDRWRAAAARLDPPVGVAVIEPFGRSGRRYDIEPGGAMLVRPDGVVAWRAGRCPPLSATAHAMLARALDAILARNAADPIEIDRPFAAAQVPADRRSHAGH